jgi:hypothetical protein
LNYTPTPVFKILFLGEDLANFAYVAQAGLELVILLLPPPE